MTEAMVGLSAIFSWTHNSPTLMHRSISVVELSLNVGSKIFETVLSLQFFHTYKIIKIHIQFQSGNFFCITSVTNIGKRERYTVLTQLRRSSIFSPLRKQLFFYPHTISRTDTPKLKTSDFTEKCPWIAYFGAIYPLHEKTNNINLSWSS